MKHLRTAAAATLVAATLSLSAMTPAAAWSSADQRAWVCSWWKAIC